MARTGEIRISVVGIDSIEESLRQINRRLDKMAVDQATFDAALTDFLADLDAGLALIQAKLDAAGVPVDLTAETQLLTDAKLKFDAMVAADTAPPA
jgi:hypothetical protein